MDVDTMTVKELKQELKSRGLKLTGKKAELQERLNAAFEDEEIAATISNNEMDDNHEATIADFEEYINDEYQRLNKNGDHDPNAEVVNIEDIINNNNQSIEQEEEKDILLHADFDLDPPSTVTADLITPQQPEKEEIISDFAEIPNNVILSNDPQALNNKTKIQDRMQRFGTRPLTDSDKIESRKRRFAAMNAQNADSLPIKKQRVDPDQDRQKILQRAQKYGTSLPKNFKLTKEETVLVHADKIERAKRFGTEHLLPAEIQKAEQEAKKIERMKRFNTNEKGQNMEQNDMKNKNIIKATDDPDKNVKLMERKLRFGTLTEADKQIQRQQRFGNNQNKQTKQKGGLQKKFSQRQQRSNQRFQKFRQFKKSNRNFKGQQGNQRGGYNKGGRGRGYNNYNRGGGNRYNNNNNNNQRGGYRRNNNRSRSQSQQHTAVQFSAADQERINQRKLRFQANGLDF